MVVTVDNVVQCVVLQFIDNLHADMKDSDLLINVHSFSTMALKTLRGSTFLWILFWSSLLGVAFFQHVLMLGLIILPIWYRKYADQLVGYWMVYCAVTRLSFAYSCTVSNLRAGGGVSSDNWFVLRQV